MKVEMAVLGSPSLKVRTVSVDVKQRRTQTAASLPLLKYMLNACTGVDRYQCRTPLSKAVTSELSGIPH